MTSLDVSMMYLLCNNFECDRIAFMMYLMYNNFECDRTQSKPHFLQVKRLNDIFIVNGRLYNP